MPPSPSLGALLACAFAAGVPCAWVVADSVYGADYGWCRFIESQGRGYVMAVTSAQRLALKPVEDRLEDAPAATRTTIPITTSPYSCGT